MIFVKDGQGLIVKVATDVDENSEHTPKHKVTESALPDGAATEETLAEVLTRLEALADADSVVKVTPGTNANASFGVVSGDLTSTTPAILMPAVADKVNTLTRITLANFGGVATMINVSDYTPGNIIYSAYVQAYDTFTETFGRDTAPKSSTASALSVASETDGVSIRVSWGGITDTE